MHGYTTAFWWSAAIFAVGAIVCGLLLRGGAREPVAGDGAGTRALVALRKFRVRSR